MFKNRAAQVTFVKTPKNDSETPKSRTPLSDAEIKMIKDTGKAVGVFLLATAVILKASDAICEIAVNICPKN